MTQIASSCIARQLAIKLSYCTAIYCRLEGTDTFVLLTITIITPPLVDNVPPVASVVFFESLLRLYIANIQSDLAIRVLSSRYLPMVCQYSPPQMNYNSLLTNDRNSYPQHLHSNLRPATTHARFKQLPYCSSYNMCIHEFETETKITSTLSSN